MGFKGKNIHMIGVGGSGMFPLALLLCAAGAHVRGIDRTISDEKRDALIENGAQVLVDCENSPAHDLTPSEDWICIVSPAIPNHHPDLRAAHRLGVKVLRRAEAIALLLAERETVCVAGSHGKSTTTAMLAWVLDKVIGANIGYMIGADLDGTQPARLGADSAVFLMEACEAYGTLSNWAPSHAILTNVDDEHVEHYDSQDALEAAFTEFLARIPTRGVLVVNGDDSRALGLVRLSGHSVLTCGFSPDNQLRAVEKAGSIHIERNGVQLGILRLAVAGRHNIQNALLVLGMALEFGITAEQILAALASFRGIKRRLQVVSDEQQPRVIDDFAHHPAEISTALQTLRQDTPGRLIVVLEPQLHSRVQRLAVDFVAALALADMCFILPVAALNEANRQVGGDRALSDAFASAERSFDACADPVDVLERLERVVAAPDTVVVMGGHTITGFAQRLATRLAAMRPQAAGPSVLFGPRTALSPDLHTVVASHVRINPEAPAIEMGHRTLSYRELWQRAGALEARIRKAGVMPGDVVGVYLRQNIDRVAAFLATLRLGAVYLPLDPTLPEQRLAHILTDASARVVIVNAASPPLPDGAPAFVSSDLLDNEAMADLGPSIPHPPSQLAYLIYTSGTTGTPKGVDVTRAAISNYAMAARNAFKLSATSRMSLISAFGFDVNIGDMAVAMAAGSCLVLPTEIEGRPGAPIGNFIANKRLSHLSLTPSALGAVPTGGYPSLTTVIVAGESCSPSLVLRWRRDGERTFINAYGPTEATVEASFSCCDGSDLVTIGRPLNNIGLCILDDALEAVEIGTKGELCIFGAGLAAGYRNQPELSELQFPTLRSPAWAPDQTDLRIYRTGDRAMIDADGNVVFLGRMDDQLKILGHRVDPSEIEAAICALPDVRDCAVTMSIDTEGHARLVAHVAPKTSGFSFDLQAVRAALAERLPRYMQPSILLPVARIPQTPNGKRDRSALVVPPTAFIKGTTKAPGTATEKRILEILAKVSPSLSVQGVRDNLSDAGMDSLDLVNLLCAIEDAFGISLDIALPPGSETVEFLSLSVDAQLNAPAIISSSGAIQSSLADVVLPHLTTWPGQSATDRGLFRHFPEKAALSAFYWMFQQGAEFEALSNALAPEDIMVFGTRSGHLVFEYTESNLAAITTLMADEIESLHTSGPIHLGGNCQGGMIMLRVTKELTRRGHTMGAVILMEQGRFPLHHGPVALVFGEGSYLNPYALLENPDSVFQAAYPHGYHVEIINGRHGQYFLPKNIASLASVITKHIRAHQPATQLLEVPQAPSIAMQSGY